MRPGITQACLPGWNIIIFTANMDLSHVVGSLFRRWRRLGVDLQNMNIWAVEFEEYLLTWRKRGRISAISRMQKGAADLAGM